MKRSWLVLITVLLAAANAQVPEGTARIHYSRPDAAFAGWVLHV